MIQISNGRDRLATVDVAPDGSVVVELEATEGESAQEETPAERAMYEGRKVRGSVVGMFLESREAALLAVAILNAHLGGEAWRNLEAAYPGVIVPPPRAVPVPNPNIIPIRRPLGPRGPGWPR